MWTKLSRALSNGCAHCTLSSESSQVPSSKLVAPVEGPRLVLVLLHLLLVDGLPDEALEWLLLNLAPALLTLQLHAGAHRSVAPLPDHAVLL